MAGRAIINNGNLTITGNGIIDTSASTYGGYGAIDNYGSLTVENGTYTGAKLASGATVKTVQTQNLLFITVHLTVQPAAYITKVLLPFITVHLKVKLAVPVILPFGLIPYETKM